MTGLVLNVDATPWRHHLRQVADTTSGLVPVAKGNGYGFGLARLAAEAEQLGSTTLAVGTAREVEQVRTAFSGDIVVLQPWRPGDPVAEALLADPRVITTVSRAEDLAALAERDAGPVLVEVRTSMTRHGLSAEEVEAIAPLLDRVDFRGWTIHLPLLETGRYAEALAHTRRVRQVRPAPLWFSHLPWAEAGAIAKEVGAEESELRLRVGTQLWLGAPETLHPLATVIDVHKVPKGERIGYRQRKAPGNGWVVVLAGGTAHGLAMEAPSSVSTLRQRAITATTGALATLGRAMSPYTIDGAKRWFVEPPHMQSSLVFLPADATPPRVGDQVPVELRLTTVTVDEVVLG
ncbi:alanine racemase [Enemella sp. A6]|uniref:alanine racemase n=1 Tax=Enemella sp. A6 TaxID=3440152 RepID=UPI003EBD66D3